MERILLPKYFIFGKNFQYSPVQFIVMYIQLHERNLVVPSET